MKARRQSEERASSQRSSLYIGWQIGTSRLNLCRGKRLREAWEVGEGLLGRVSWSLSSVPSVIQAETIMAKLLGRCDGVEEGRSDWRGCALVLKVPTVEWHLQ